MNCAAGGGLASVREPEPRDQSPGSHRAQAATPSVPWVVLRHLQSVIEKAVVMGMAPGVSSTSSPDGVNKASQSLSELVTAYASLLASNGRMATALDYLEHVPGEVRSEAQGGLQGGRQGEHKRNSAHRGGG